MDPDRPKKKLTKDVNIQKHHVFIAIGVVVLLILLKFAYNGLSLNNELKDLNLSPAGVKEKFKATEDKLKQVQQKIVDCSAEKTKQQQQLKGCQDQQALADKEIQQKELEMSQQIAAANTKANQAQAQISVWKGKYDQIVSTSAYNICCKERVDDPTVDSYEILGDRIVCGKGKNVTVNCK